MGKTTKTDSAHQITAEDLRAAGFTVPVPFFGMLECGPHKGRAVITIELRGLKRAYIQYRTEGTQIVLKNLKTIEQLKTLIEIL